MRITSDLDTHRDEMKDPCHTRSELGVVEKNNKVEISFQWKFHRMILIVSENLFGSIGYL